MRFTSEEFNIMVEELTSDPISYDMFTVILEKTIKPYLAAKCYCSALRHYDCAVDLYHESYIKIMQTVVTKFLYNPKYNGKIQNIPENFSMYIYTIARNTFLSALDDKTVNLDKKKKDDEEQVDKTENEKSVVGKKSDEKAGKKLKEEPTDPDLLGTGKNSVSTKQYFDDESENRRIENIQDKLEEAFAFVLSPESGASVHIILAWLAINVYMVTLELSKIESNHFVTETFSKKTLSDMFLDVVMASDDISWLQISEEQRLYIASELKKEWKDGRKYRDVTFEELYMSAGSLKSVSDWSNRINAKIKKKLKNKKDN